MTLLTSLSRPFSSKKDWPKRLRRWWWILQIGTPLFYISVFFMPIGHLWTTEIPPFQELQVSQGIVSIEKQRSGSIIFLTETSGKHLYTCQITYGRRHGCYPQSKIENLEGKQATAWWFERTAYPWAWVHQRQLVRLVVENQEEIAYGKVVETFDGMKKFSFYFSVFMLVALLLSMWWYDSWINLCVVHERENPPRSFLSVKKFYKR